ncbi:MAG TPA: TonB-dependent receptor [Candidatus Angelobacter sp.]|nr:TonB-dependent receptor [Candidatus Angelobacter sp.]
MRRNYFPTAIGLLGLLVLLATLAANAQTSGTAPAIAPEAPPVVIEVTGEGVPESASSASLVVLTREEIEQKHASDFADLLRDVPFLHVAQNGSRGSLASGTIRGGKPNFTLILVDGTPVNDISNVLGGSVDLSSISTDNIERVEIMRGPLSSIYGSEAVSGVINIVSRTETAKPSGVLDIEGGNFGTGRLGVDLRGNSRHSSYGLAASYLNLSQQVLSDEFSLATVAADFRHEIESNKVVLAHARYQRDQDSSFPENGGGPDLSILRIPQRQHSTGIAIDTEFHHQVEHLWLYSLDANYFQREARASIPAVLDKVHPSFKSLPSQEETAEFRRTQARFSNQFLFTSKLSGRLNFGFIDENGTNNDLLAGRFPSRFHLDRPAFEGDGEIVFASGRLTATAGTGVNKSAGFNAHPATRLGANIRMFGSKTTLKTSWASAYKLPSMFALGDPSVGNPALRPERSASYDLGIEQKFERMHARASVTYFWNSLTDLIDFSATGFKLVNRSNAHTQGAEFFLSSILHSRLRLSGDLAYLDWKLFGTREPLRDVPHWEGGISADCAVTHKLHAQANTRWMGRRFDFQVPAPFIDSVGGFSTTNAVLSYEMSKKLSTYVVIDNLLNRRYHEFLGFPNPGIYARIGVRYRLFEHDTVAQQTATSK